MKILTRFDTLKKNCYPVSSNCLKFVAEIVVFYLPLVLAVFDWYFFVVWYDLTLKAYNVWPDQFLLLLYLLFLYFKYFADAVK